MSNILNEAFKAMNLIESEDFDLGSLEDMSKINSYLDDEDNMDVTDATVVDPEATEEDEIQNSYVGKIICQCPICKGLTYKNPEEIVIDEENGLVDVGVECPTCFSDSGLTIIGEVSSYSETEATEAEEVTNEPIVDDAEDATEPTKEIDTNEVKDEKDTEIEESVQSKSKHLCMETCGEASITEELEDVQISADGMSIGVDSNTDGALDLHINTEETTEDTTTDDEVITPLDDETKTELNIDTDDELESDDEDDIDDFDEESFDIQSESYLKSKYENVNSYKTSDVSTKNNKLVVEGIITFNSGKKGKTSFVLESLSKTKNECLFRCKNENINLDFIARGQVNNKSFVTESLNNTIHSTLKGKKLTESLSKPLTNLHLKENLSESDWSEEEWNKIQEFEDFQKGLAEIIIDGFGINDLMNTSPEDWVVMDVNDDEDLGYYLVNEYGEPSDEDKMNYFDYEKYGRDYRLESSGNFVDGVFIERIY